MLPLSARCMRVLLHFRMGTHSLLVVLGRRTKTPRAQPLARGACVSDVTSMLLETNAT